MIRSISLQVYFYPWNNCRECVAYLHMADGLIINVPTHNCIDAAKQNKFNLLFYLPTYPNDKLLWQLWRHWSYRRKSTTGSILFYNFYLGVCILLRVWHQGERWKSLTLILFHTAVLYTTLKNLWLETEALTSTSKTAADSCHYWDLCISGMHLHLLITMGTTCKIIMTLFLVSIQSNMVP
jgi:hypothetical protein